MRTMLIDGDESGLDLLERLLTRYTSFVIVGKYSQPEKAIVRVQQERVDVVFLDIQLPSMSGIQTAESLLQINPEIEIVFVTAHNHYATEAFEVGVVDYVLKPIDSKRLNKTVDRLLARRGSATRSVRIDGPHVQDEIAGYKFAFLSFGGFEWISDWQSMTPVKWRRSKERELMAYLLHHRGQLVLKEKIIEELWPATSPEQAMTFLHTCVYNLRKMIRKYGCNAILEYRNNGYRYEMQEVWFDLEAFEQIYEDNLQINSANLHIFEYIEKVYRGDYLEQDEFEWARDRREELQNQYILLMKRLADYYRSENRLSEAERCLRNALLKNPYLDDINERLLTIYALRGDRHAMNRHFNEFVNLLKEELRIEPMESTIRLHHQLCRGIVSKIETD